jgi:hypothetical protein
LEQETHVNTDPSPDAPPTQPDPAEASALEATMDANGTAPPSVEPEASSPALTPSPNPEWVSAPVTTSAESADLPEPPAFPREAEPPAATVLSSGEAGEASLPVTVTDPLPTVESSLEREAVESEPGAAVSSVEGGVYAEDARAAAGALIESPDEPPIHGDPLAGVVEAEGGGEPEPGLEDGATAAAAGLAWGAEPAALTAEEQEEQELAEEGYQAGPNWMLALVCLWAAITSFVEAWAYLHPAGAAPGNMRSFAFAGYALLGVGLTLFGVDALGRSHHRRGGRRFVAVLLPFLFTLAGVVCLLLDKAPGRRI